MTMQARRVVAYRRAASMTSVEGRSDLRPLRGRFDVFGEHFESDGIGTDEFLVI